LNISFLFSPHTEVSRGYAITTEGFKRKLTTTLSADVKGYSRLMREHEVATMQMLEHYGEVMAPVIR